MTDKKKRSLDRVVAIASEEFLTREFDEVSIASIAGRAHCSTTTIYAAFGGKEGLFLRALTHRMSKVRHPQLDRVSGRSALHSLLVFAEAHIRYLASLRMRREFSTFAAHTRLMRPVVTKIIRSTYQDLSRALSEVVRCCITEGSMRSLEPEIATYNIIAISNYETQTFGILFGDETPVDVQETLRRIFIPLLSASGKRQLQRYLGEPQA